MRDELTNFSPELQTALHDALPDASGGYTVEEVQEMLDYTQKGVIKNTLQNCRKILMYDPYLHGAVKYNLLTERPVIAKEMDWNRKNYGEQFTDEDQAQIHLYMEETYGITSVARIEEALLLVAGENQYHPIRECLNRLKWDGTERVRYALHHFLGTEASDYSYELLKLFMLGAISRVFTPGIKFDYILCIVGDQGSGKSSFFRFLAIKDDWFTDDLKDLEVEKSYEKMQGHWIIEMSEMIATIKAKTNEAIKSFLSRQKEIYRTPYSKYPLDRKRQCVFTGTTNKAYFLPNDRTGNRRFLPIRANPEEAEVFILDNEPESRRYIEQMWAEMMELYRSGKYELKLSKEMEKTVQERQKEFIQEDVDAGVILQYMEDTDHVQVCSKMLFKEALGNEFQAPTRWQTNEICEIVNQLISTGRLKGWKAFESPRRFGKEYGTQRGWERAYGDANKAASAPETNGDGFMELPPEMPNPFDENDESQLVLPFR